MQYYVDEIGSKSVWKYLLSQHKPFWSLPNELTYDWWKKLWLFQLSALYIWYVKYSLMAYYSDCHKLHKSTGIFKSVSERLYHRWYFGCYALLNYSLLHSVGLHFILLKFINLMLFLIFPLFFFCQLSQSQIWVQLC